MLLRGEGERVGRGCKGEKGIGDVKSGDMGLLVKSFSGSFECIGLMFGSLFVFWLWFLFGKVLLLVEVVFLFVLIIVVLVS